MLLPFYYNYSSSSSSMTPTLQRASFDSTTFLSARDFEVQGTYCLVGAWILTNTQQIFSSSIYDHHSRPFIILTGGRNQRISHLWTENGNHCGVFYLVLLVISGYIWAGTRESAEVRRTNHGPIMAGAPVTWWIVQLASTTGVTHLQKNHRWLWRGWD